MYKLTQVTANLKLNISFCLILSGPQLTLATGHAVGLRVNADETDKRIIAELIVLVIGVDRIEAITEGVAG